MDNRVSAPSGATNYTGGGMESSSMNVAPARDSAYEMVNNPSVRPMNTGRTFNTTLPAQRFLYSVITTIEHFPARGPPALPTTSTRVVSFSSEQRTRMVRMALPHGGSTVITEEFRLIEEWGDQLHDDYSSSDDDSDWWWDSDDDAPDFERIPVVRSQLNGANGEATGSDDVRKKMKWRMPPTCEPLGNEPLTERLSAYDGLSIESSEGSQLSMSRKAIRRRNERAALQRIKADKKKPNFDRKADDKRVRTEEFFEDIRVTLEHSDEVSALGMSSLGASTVSSGVISVDSYGDLRTGVPPAGFTRPAGAPSVASNSVDPVYVDDDDLSELSGEDEPLLAQERKDKCTALVPISAVRNVPRYHGRTAALAHNCTDLVPVIGAVRDLGSEADHQRIDSTLRASARVFTKMADLPPEEWIAEPLIKMACYYNKKSTWAEYFFGPSGLFCCCVGDAFTPVSDEEYRPLDRGKIVEINRRFVVSFGSRIGLLRLPEFNRVSRHWDSYAEVDVHKQMLDKILAQRGGITNFKHAHSNLASAYGREFPDVPFNIRCNTIKVAVQIIRLANEEFRESEPIGMSEFSSSIPIK